MFKAFRQTLSGGVKWHNKSEKDREDSRKHAAKRASQSRESGLTNREYAEAKGISKRQASKIRRGIK